MADSDLNGSEDTTVFSQVFCGQEELKKARPYLVIVAGPDQGKQFVLDRPYNIFGRSRDVDISLSDSKISRKHGAFTLDAEGVVLEDLCSTNGSFVDGQRVEHARLNASARIQVGNTIFKIAYKSAAEVDSEQDLVKAANTDSLTNIPNRRFFLTRLSEEHAYSRRTSDNLTVVLCDVDYFKRVNDTFGHAAGDQVLMHLVEILRKEIRQEDVLARYGGEEFIMLLRHSSPDAAEKWADRVREKVAGSGLIFQEKRISITISLGVCCRPALEIDDLGRFIQLADQALYKAKNDGRDRVELS